MRKARRMNKRKTNNNQKQNKKTKLNKTKQNIKQAIKYISEWLNWID